MFYTMTLYRRCWNRSETKRSWWNALSRTRWKQMESGGTYWKLLVSYRAWARLTPTLTHVVTYELVTSGAEDRAMSTCILRALSIRISKCSQCQLNVKPRLQKRGQGRRTCGTQAVHENWRSLCRPQNRGDTCHVPKPWGARRPFIWSSGASPLWMVY